MIVFVIYETVMMLNGDATSITVDKTVEDNINVYVSILDNNIG